LPHMRAETARSYETWSNGTAPVARIRATASSVVPISSPLQPTSAEAPDSRYFPPLMSALIISRVTKFIVIPGRSLRCGGLVVVMTGDRNFPGNCWFNTSKTCSCLAPVTTRAGAPSFSIGGLGVVEVLSAAKCSDAKENILVGFSRRIAAVKSPTMLRKSICPIKYLKLSSFRDTLRSFR